MVLKIIFYYIKEISNVFNNNIIYFHCGKEGRKIDNIQCNPKVSFCVLTNTQVLLDKFTAIYKSAIVAFSERDSVLFELIKKYSPSFTEYANHYIEKNGAYTNILIINIAHSIGEVRS